MLTAKINNSEIHLEFQESVYQIDLELYIFKESSGTGTKQHFNKTWEHGVLTINLPLCNNVDLVILSVNEFNYIEIDLVQKITNSNEYTFGPLENPKLIDLFKEKFSSTTGIQKPIKLETKTENVYAEYTRSVNGVATNIQDSI